MFIGKKVKCNKCGIQNTAGSYRCGYCGAILGNKKEDDTNLKTSIETSPMYEVSSESTANLDVVSSTYEDGSESTANSDEMSSTYEVSSESTANLDEVDSADSNKQSLDEYKQTLDNYRKYKMIVSIIILIIFFMVRIIFATSR